MALSGLPVLQIRQEVASEMKQAALDSRTCRTEKVSKRLCCRSCWWLLFLLLVLLMLLTTADSAAATCLPKQSRVQQFDDAGAKAYLSPVVFKGLVKSRTQVDALGLYEATFLIVQTLKGFAHQQPKKRRRRLQFAAPVASGVACRQGAVAAMVEMNATYLVFADRASHHQFRPLAPPLPATKRHDDAVEKVLCPTCVLRPPTVSGLHNVTVKTKLSKLKLTCLYDGSPLPLIEWYKRGRRIEPTRRTKIVNKKRRSMLTIARVSKSDAGKYECKAVSVTDEKVCASAHVTVINEQAPVFPPPINAPPIFPPFRFDDNTTLKPFEFLPCPFDSYCLNGGTCLYYEAVGELVCKCAEGYKGKRCESKDFYNRGSKRRRTSCFGGDNSQQQQQSQPQAALSAATLAPRRRVFDCLTSSNGANSLRRRRLRDLARFSLQNLATESPIQGPRPSPRFRTPK